MEIRTGILGGEYPICVASIFIVRNSVCNLALKPSLHVLDRWANLHNPPVILKHCIKAGYGLGLSRARRWPEK